MTTQQADQVGSEFLHEVIEGAPGGERPATLAIGMAGVKVGGGPKTRVCGPVPLPPYCRG